MTLFDCFIIVVATASAMALIVAAVAYSDSRQHKHKFDSQVGMIEFWSGTTFLQCKCGSMGREYDGVWRKIQ